MQICSQPIEVRGLDAAVAERCGGEELREPLSRAEPCGVDIARSFS